MNADVVADGALSRSARKCQRLAFVLCQPVLGRLRNQPLAIIMAPSAMGNPS
jgi:hypothetical protein